MAFFRDFFRPKARFSSLGITSDWHCHILPGVDDGVSTVEEAVTILQSMAERGYKHVVLTPHLNPDIFPDNTESRIRRRYDLFVEALPEEITSRLTFSLGAEYMVTPEFHQRNPDELIQFDDGKVLVEMSYFFKSKNIEESLFNIVSADLTPVMAHPERYLYLADSLDKFKRFHEMGCEFQMNLLSLSGVYGTGSIRILKHLLEQGWYSYFGTDTHSLNHFEMVKKVKVKRSWVTQFGGIKK